MIKNQIKKIEDVAELMIPLLDELKEMEGEEVMAELSKIENFIDGYFLNKDLTNEELLVKVATLVNELYIKIFDLVWLGSATDAYFGLIINIIFDYLKKRGVLIFFIVDNVIRDDKFELIKHLFNCAGLKVITPNSIIPSHASNAPVYTKGKALDYKAIEVMIDECNKKNDHIIYIEKDDSVNYLSDVLKLAEEFQNKYFCLFRNKGADSPEKAQVLLGSFGDILDK